MPFPAATGRAPCAARGIARPLTPTLPPQRGGREKARPSASPRVPSPRPSPRNAGGGGKPGHRPRPGFPRPLPRGRGRVRGRARSGRATGSRDPRLSPGPRRPDGKARAGAKATVLGRMPVGISRDRGLPSPPAFGGSACSARSARCHGHPARGDFQCKSRAGCPCHTGAARGAGAAPWRGRLGEPSLPVGAAAQARRAGAPIHSSFKTQHSKLGRRAAPSRH